jgi:peptide/nickel transport system substrate-binding protein
MTLSKRIAPLVAAAALVLAGCSAGGTDTSSDSGSLTLGVLAEPVSWDASQAHVGHLLQPYQVVYDSLLLRMPDGTLSPMLATKSEYNKDRTVLTLDLRDDVTFSDGAKFDAAAAKANLDNFRKANGPQMGQLAAVKDVTVVDADTIELDLSAPDPALEFSLSQAAGLMGSPKAIGTEGIKTTPVGSGPYVLDSVASVPGSRLVFKARQDYWNKDLQKFSTVTLRTLPDLTARTNALVSGQVDAALLDPKTGKQAEGAGMKLATNQVDWSGLLLMDRDGAVNEALGDVRVRQAINYALDRKTILDQVMLGRGTPTSQVFGKDSGAWVEELEDKYPYDPSKAKALLEEAGYSEGVTLSVPGLPGAETLLAVLKQQLSDVGIAFEVDAPIASTFYTDVAAKKFTAIEFNLFQGEPWVAINQMIAEGALYNPFGNTTPELQAAIDATQSGGDDSDTAAQDVNRYVTDNAWFAPLFRVDQMYYYKSSITVTPQVQQAVPSIYNYAPAS